MSSPSIVPIDTSITVTLARNVSRVAISPVSNTRKNGATSTSTGSTSRPTVAPTTTSVKSQTGTPVRFSMNKTASTTQGSAPTAAQTAPAFGDNRPPRCAVTPIASATANTAAPAGQYHSAGVNSGRAGVL